MGKKSYLVNITILLLLIILCFSGCVQKEESMNAVFSENMNSEEKNDRITNGETTNDVHLWTEIGQKIKNLESLSNINEAVIIVNGYNITKKDVETQKIYAEFLKDEDIREKIYGLIKTKVIETEAKRLGISPDEEAINEYIKQSKDALEKGETGTEILLALMTGLGVTTEEYLSILREEIYTLYQSSALQQHLEQRENNFDYSIYTEDLVNKAEVEFLDEELEKMMRDYVN